MKRAGQHPLRYFNVSIQWCVAKSYMAIIEANHFWRIFCSPPPLHSRTTCTSNRHLRATVAHILFFYQTYGVMAFCSQPTLIPSRLNCHQYRRPRPAASSQPRLPFVCKAPTPPPPRLAEQRALSSLNELNTRARTVKCPFWRRRFVDALDAMQHVLAWAIVVRHKSLSLPISLSVPNSSVPSLMDPTSDKALHLPLEQRLELIRSDFEKRQYYITGRLSKNIYTDDCLFDGPDPDVPVVGLEKYTDAMAGLFERKLSRVDLLAIQITSENTIHAEWRLEGALNLPWKPPIKPYTGETVYTFDERGLVVTHVESWSLSAFEAFVSVLWPGFGQPPAPPVEVLLAHRKSAADTEHDLEHATTE